MQSTQTSEQEQGATAEDLAWLEQQVENRETLSARYKETAREQRSHGYTLDADASYLRARNNADAAARLRRIAATVRAALG